MPNLPPITRRLLYLWAGLWILSFLTDLASGQGQGLSRWLSLYPRGILSGDLGSFPGILGYALIHNPSGVLHLAMNALVFYWFAPEAERLFPGKAFLKLLLASTLAGAAFSLLLTLSGAELFQHQIIGGGSGLVMTMVALSAAMYPDRRVNLFVIQPKLLSCFLVLVVLDFLGMMATFAGRDGIVANHVHLAGALVGWLWVDGFGRLGWNLPSPLRNWKRKQQQRKSAAKQSKARAEHEELDRILEKISQQGMPSLTKQERAFLEKRSRDRRP